MVPNKPEYTTISFKKITQMVKGGWISVRDFKFKLHRHWGDFYYSNVRIAPETKKEEAQLTNWYTSFNELYLQDEDVITGQDRGGGCL